MVVLGASSVCDFGGFNFNFFELGLHWLLTHEKKIDGYHA